MNKYDNQFITNYNIAKTHLFWLEKYFEQLQLILPISNNTFNNEENVKLIDSYLFRFAALQDTIGRSLFKLSLQKLGEEVFDKSFIDIFNRLEKLGIIVDYEKWDSLRSLRNEISHNYSSSVEQNIERINKIISLKDDLANYLHSIAKYFNLNN